MKRTCPCCRRNRVGPIRTWHRNTMYVNNSLNFITCCYHCVTEDDYQKYWDWAEYYSGQGFIFDRTPFKPRSQRNYVE